MNGTTVESSAELAEEVRAHQGPALLAIEMRHRWLDGLAVDSRGQRLELLGQHVDRSHHTLHHDLPPALGGKDTGPAPTEALLSAVAACVSGIFVEAAAQQGIPIDALEVSTRGEIDLRGLFQVADVRSGLSGVTLTIDVRSGAGDEALEQLARAALQLSPSADSLANPVPMKLLVRRLPQH